MNRPADVQAAATALPDSDDLIGRLHFDTKEGRIWLDDQRMLLLHSSALGVLRQELIEALGIDAARGLLTRIGYNSGAHDADLARRLRGSRTEDAVMVGPQLHMLEGVVRVEPVHMEVDVEHGHFVGQFNWHGSAEAEVHIQRYGVGSEPVCWQQAGYASGFVSRFLGRPVVFREICCRAQGAPHCVVLGKPAEHWDDAEGAVQSLRADKLSMGPSAAYRQEDETQGPLGDVDVVGVSAGFNAVCHMVRRAAHTQATVLFLGESGVGKECFARAMHSISERATKESSAARMMQPGLSLSLAPTFSSVTS